MKAVIMAGGRGTRFWPASRENRPKQFLNIAGQRTMLQETMARLDPLLRPEQMRIVCSAAFVKNVADQVPGFAPERVIVEPAARGTAACIGYAALSLRRETPDEVMAVLPADHVVADVPEFQRALQAAETLAQDGWLVTFGIPAAYPATGYGYLERGKLIGLIHGRAAYQIRGFLEKPDLPKAAALVDTGRHDWNSGMFVWRVDAILKAIEKFLPELHRTLSEIDSDWDDTAGHEKLFSALEPVSIDVGVLEKAEKLAVIPCDMGWSDVGNWRSLEDLLPRDHNGNVSNANYVQIDSSGCIVQATHGKLVALLGVENLVVVETPDVVLVCQTDRTEDVRQLVAQLAERGLTDYL